jgi:hypothetical protein
MLVSRVALALAAGVSVASAFTVPTALPRATRTRAAVTSVNMAVKKKDKYTITSEKMLHPLLHNGEGHKPLAASNARPRTAPHTRSMQMNTKMLLPRRPCCLHRDATARMLRAAPASCMPNLAFPRPSPGVKQAPQYLTCSPATALPGDGIGPEIIAGAITACDVSKISTLVLHTGHPAEA